MTNYEKARVIVKQYETKHNDTSELWWFDLKDIAMQAMQWKDEQEIEFLRSLLFQSATQNIFDRINNRIKLLKGE